LIDDDQCCVCLELHADCSHADKLNFRTSTSQSSDRQA
jgi:hypothetical protein